MIFRPKTPLIGKMIDPQLNQLREWKQIILKLKDLEKADGRPPALQVSSKKQ